MRTTSHKLVYILGGFGLFPFIISAYLNITETSFMGKSGTYLFITYGAVILSFLGGLLWGQAIHKERNAYSNYLLISSNVLSLSAWFSLIINVPQLSIALLLLGFISAFWVEARWLKLIGTPQYLYTNMRFSITLSVCVLHILMLFPYY